MPVKSEGGSETNTVLDIFSRIQKYVVGKKTLETSGENVKLHSFRVEKCQNTLVSSFKVVSRYHVVRVVHPFHRIWPLQVPIEVPLRSVRSFYRNSMLYTLLEGGKIHSFRV
jgi:N-glycosylase/DNA lyase